MNLSNRKIVDRHLMSLSDICKYPSELLEKLRNTPHAATLAEYCNRAVADKSLSDCTRHTALAVSTAIRSNISLQDAWVMVVGKAYPELKDHNIDTYLEVCEQARFALQTGGMTYKIGNKVVSAELAHQENETGTRMSNEWLGTHATAVCLLENFTHKDWHIPSYELSSAPNAYAVTMKMLHIQIHSLFSKTRDKIDRDVRIDFTKRFPFAHREFGDSCVSPFGYLEAAVVKYIFNSDDKLSIDLIYKTATLYYQKCAHPYPHIAAVSLLYTSVIGSMIKVYKNLVQDLNNMVTYNKDKNINFRKDWKPISETADKLQRVVSHRATGDRNNPYGDLYKSQIDSFIRKVVEEYPYIVTSHADMEILKCYSHITLYAMRKRMVDGELIPYSWVKDVIYILGGPTKARRFFQEMRNATFFRNMPLDDIDDAADYLADYFLPRQYMELKIHRDDDNIELAIVEDGEKSKKALQLYPAIMEWRRNMNGNLTPEYEYTPTMEQRIRDHYWLWLFQNPGKPLMPEQLASMYNILGDSMRAVDRMLQSMGDIAKSSRAVLRKLRKADMEPLRQRSVIMTYRQKGFKIPEGYEGIFFNEIMHYGGVKN